jgi:hypothetical protein
MADETNDPEFIKRLIDYRQQLLDHSGEMQCQLDKNILALSGGAIAVSFVFLDKAKSALGIVQFGSQSLLLWAWICWGVSILAILASFFTSSLALAKAADLVDQRTIFLKWSKSPWNRLTKFLNPMAMILFCVGTAFLICFIKINMPRL